MQNFPPIGSVLSADEKRDAIHIAIAPVTSDETVLAGQHVGMAPNGKVSWRVSPKIGIVDPFLGTAIEPGQRFFIFLYPRTVTSLRHEWTHPDFDPVVAETVRDMSADLEPFDKAKSEQWLRAFVEGSGNLPDYEMVINAAAGFDHYKVIDGYGDVSSENNGEFLTFLGRNAGGEIPPEFWQHVEIVTGKKIPSDRRPSYFSCSC